MKVVRIIARLNVGGPARHVVWLTAGLQGRNYESLLVSGTVPEGEEDMSYFADQQNVKPLYLSEMSREISFKDAITVWKLYRLFLRERPDVVHTHTAKAGTVGRVAGLLYRWATISALIGRPRRCRFVHTYHGHIFHGYYGQFKTNIFLTIERMLARMITDRLIVVSEQQRQEINETFRVGRAEQFRVVPLGLDTGVFADWQNRMMTLRQKFGAEPGQTLVGIVGRLTEIKEHSLFLKSAALLKKSQGNRVKFVVIGDGGLRQQLEDQSRSLGLNGHLVFAGNRHDPENFYPALDIVALTSRNEGTPLTLIEAMANGRAVVATAVGGVVDLLGESTESRPELPYVVCARGIKVSSHNAEAFAAGLERMVVDASLREKVSAAGLAYVAQQHSKDRLINDVRALYDELLQHSQVSVRTQSSEVVF